MDKKNIEKEQERELSEAEQKRLRHLEEVTAEYIAQGYEKKELLVSVVSANVIALAAMIPLYGAGMWIFIARNGVENLHLRMNEAIAMLVWFVILIPAHELLHGLTWSLFSEHHWKDIEFGIMKGYMTPYCTCTVPLKKGPYLLGALMPGLVLGVIPTVIAVLAGSFLWFTIGIAMTLSAAGDALIVAKVLGYHTEKKEIVYMDHPTMAGTIVFER